MSRHAEQTADCVLRTGHSSSFCRDVVPGQLPRDTGRDRSRVRHYGDLMWSPGSHAFYTGPGSYGPKDRAACLQRCMSISAGDAHMSSMCASACSAAPYGRTVGSGATSMPRAWMANNIGSGALTTWPWIPTTGYRDGLPGMRLRH